MRDLLDILAAFAALPKDEPATLATVVRVEGSSYRLPGAKMLIDTAGRRTGAVSGGCLEADIARRGRLLSPEQPHTLVRYDGADEDASWNYNLGCNGSIEVLIERLTPASETAADSARRGLEFLTRCLDQRRPAATLTVFAAPAAAGVAVGARLRLTADSLEGDPVPETLRSALLDEAGHVFNTGVTATVTVETPAGPVAGLAEAIRPPLPLVIFGAGYDAVPVVRQAKQLGWHVTVCDRRASYARRDRFPGADQILVASAEEAAVRIRLTTDSAVVIMTHHYPDDRALLHHGLASGAGYVGLLGPKARADRLLADLASSGVQFSPSELRRLHAPIGLDLGAEGPEQVALAVVAEVVAATRGRGAGFLRDRVGAIHTPAPTRVVALDGTPAASF